MANQVDGGTQAQGVVSGLDQEELTLREKMAKQGNATRVGDDDHCVPGETPVGTGEADDAFGAPAGGLLPHNHPESGRCVRCNESFIFRTCSMLT